MLEAFFSQLNVQRQDVLNSGVAFLVHVKSRDLGRIDAQLGDHPADRLVELSARQLGLDAGY